jgi:hypothetical protein
VFRLPLTAGLSLGTFQGKLGLAGGWLCGVKDWSDNQPDGLDLLDV